MGSKVKKLKLSPDHSKLCYYVGELFQMIRDRFYASSKVINRRSMTRYDQIMESITRLLYESEDFRYENDIHTCNYILERIEIFMNMERTKLRRSRRFVQIDVIGETALVLLGYCTQPDPGDLNEMMEILRHLSDPATITMIILRGKGFSEEEIGVKFNCCQSTVNKRINEALNETLQVPGLTG